MRGGHSVRCLRVGSVSERAELRPEGARLVRKWSVWSVPSVWSIWWVLSALSGDWKNRIDLFNRMGRRQIDKTDLRHQTNEVLQV